MPDRLIRDEIMRSRRFRRLPTDTHRLLFVYLLLSADPFGNLEGDSENLGAILRRDLSDDEARELIAALSDVDLVRPYEVDGKQLIHIPRYRQRLKYEKGRLPRPPDSLEDPWVSIAIQSKQLRTKDSTHTVTAQDATTSSTASGQDATTSTRAPALTRTSADDPVMSSPRSDLIRSDLNRVVPAESTQRARGELTSTSKSVEKIPENENDTRTPSERVAELADKLKAPRDRHLSPAEQREWIGQQLAAAKAAKGRTP